MFVVEAMQVPPLHHLMHSLRYSAVVTVIPETLRVPADHSPTLPASLSQGRNVLYLNLTTERSVSLSLLISDALIPPYVIQLSPLDVSTVPLISLISLYSSRSVTQIEIKPSVRFSCYGTREHH